jgi:hypothetical protein
MEQMAVVYFHFWLIATIFKKRFPGIRQCNSNKRDWRNAFSLR